MITEAQIEAEILATLVHREDDSSACPSEVARALAPLENDWRALMPRIRNAIGELARSDLVTATRESLTLTPDHLEGGPIRIRRGKRFPGSTGR